MELTWFGHSTFAIQMGKTRILIDPFFSDNPVWGKGWEEPAKECTHVLLTHGHGDHIGDTVEICNATGATLIANHELCMYLVSNGVDKERIEPGNHGGTIDCGSFTATFVHASHSSSVQAEDGSNIYLGNPCGIVLHAPQEKSVYHMGDTDIFSDMALIQELHQPAIGLVPVGDRFTMGGAVAALACRRYFNFETIIPCHYGTFPVLDADANQFLGAMDDKASCVKIPEIGQAITI